MLYIYSDFKWGPLKITWWCCWPICAGWQTWRRSRRQPSAQTGGKAAFETTPLSQCFPVWNPNMENVTFVTHWWNVSTLIPDRPWPIGPNVSAVGAWPMTKTEGPRQQPECLSPNGILPYFYAQCPYLTLCFPFYYSTLPYCEHHTSKGVCFRRSLSIGVDVRFHQGRRRKRSQILLVVCDDGYIASTTSNMEELWEFASAFLVKQGNIGFFHGLYSLVKLT